MRVDERDGERKERKEAEEERERVLCIKTKTTLRGKQSTMWKKVELFRIQDL